MVETSIERDSAALSIYRQIYSRRLYLIAPNTFPFNVHFHSTDYKTQYRECFKPSSNRYFPKAIRGLDVSLV
jgi:hypothetical protein